EPPEDGSPRGRPAGTSRSLRPPPTPRRGSWPSRTGTGARRTPRRAPRSRTRRLHPVCHKTDRGDAAASRQPVTATGPDQESFGAEALGQRRGAVVGDPPRQVACRERRAAAAEGGDDPAADAPVACSIRRLASAHDGWAGSFGPADGQQRAFAAVRIASGTVAGADIHDRVVPAVSGFPRQLGLIERDGLRGGRDAAEQDASEYAADVRVSERDALAIGKTRDGCRGVRPDAGK